MRKIFFAALFLFLSVVACETPGTISTITPTQPANLPGLVGTAAYYAAEKALATPTQLPPGVVASPVPPSAGDIAATVAWAGISAAMTKSAADLQMQNANATQTAIAAHAAATQSAGASATAEYWKAVAWSATLTAAPQQTGTAYPPTMTAYSWTQTAIPLEATSNAAQLFAQQTVVSGQAEGMAMNVDKQKWAGTGNTLIVWIAIAAVLIITGVYVYKMTKFVKMSPDGSVWAVEGKRGRKQVVNSGRMSTPVLTLSPETDSAQAGGMVNEEFQRDVTGRAQKVEALAVMPQGNLTQPMNMINRLFGGKPNYHINIITPPESDMRELEEGLDRDE